MNTELIADDCIRIVGAVVRDAVGRVLLVRKAGTDAFMQPGGKPKAGEYPLDTLSREIREELGCEIDRESAEHFGTCEAPAVNEPDCVVIAELYSVSLRGQPQAMAEIAELKWVDAGNLDETPLAPLTAMHVLKPLADR